MASHVVSKPDVEIETSVAGEGPTLLILPSYGWDSGEDFDDIAARAVREGWRVLRPQPRGVAGSVGPMEGVTLHDLADNAAAVINAHGVGPAVLLGHASRAHSGQYSSDRPSTLGKGGRPGGVAGYQGSRRHRRGANHRR